MKSELPVSSRASAQNALLSYVSDLHYRDNQIRSGIDQLGVSADAKALLHSLSSATVTVGNLVLKIGRKLIDLLLALVREFPNLSFGVMFGLLVGAVISALPLVGAALGSIITPLAVMFGVALTFPRELDGDLGRRVQSIVDRLSALAE